MTRDEAIEIEIKNYSKYDLHAHKHDLAKANVDNLIELGLLKVDEPKGKLIYQLSAKLDLPASRLELILDTLGFKVTLK